jgi:hypothetical protein
MRVCTNPHIFFTYTLYGILPKIIFENKAIFICKRHSNPLILLCSLLGVTLYPQPFNPQSPFLTLSIYPLYKPFWTC